jgi:hypothetical protein
VTGEVANSQEQCMHPFAVLVGAISVFAAVYVVAIADARSVEKQTVAVRSLACLSSDTLERILDSSRDGAIHRVIAKIKNGECVILEPGTNLIVVRHGFSTHAVEVTGKLMWVPVTALPAKVSANL